MTAEPLPRTRRLTAVHDPVLGTTTDPQGIRILLIELVRGAVAVQREPQLVLSSPGNLADHRGSDRTVVGLEDQRRRAFPATVRFDPRAQPRDPVSGCELGQIAPVHTDIGETPPTVRIGTPMRVLRVQHPVLQVRTVHEVHRARLTGGDTRPRLPHGRVVAVDERDRGHRRADAGSQARARRPSAPPRSNSPDSLWTVSPVFRSVSRPNQALKTLTHRMVRTDQGNPFCVH